MREAGIDPADLPLELGLFGAEPWTEEMRDAARRASSGFDAVNFYGLSEIVRARRRGRVHRGPRRAARAGGPLPGRGASTPRRATPVPEGAEGELVFTTLTKEALPLLRYRTGDIALPHRRALRVRPHDGAHRARSAAGSTTC